MLLHLCFTEGVKVQMRRQLYTSSENIPATDPHLYVSPELNTLGLDAASESTSHNEVRMPHGGTDMKGLTGVMLSGDFVVLVIIFDTSSNM